MIYNSFTLTPSQSPITHAILVWVIFMMNDRILIVEDDAAISKLINTNLALSGYQTVCTMDGRQAVEAIHAQRFDLALCDIMLPELDGFELLPYMKEAAAVISEELSPEGHTATVGLLLHKPVIIGAVHATRRLHDGVQVSVDCARGIVQVMPQ